ncbi:archemetzincin [Candidatus Bathyarchaeota archaeon]|nr:MAG: archemetzincin [Candidatus Bathyarchaeota archaeon]
MRILILPIDLRDRRILNEIADGLSKVFSGSLCLISKSILPIPRKAYNASRRQYLSTIILNCVKDYAERNRNKSTFNRILGVTDVDLYAPGLNFIFGEAELLGEAAIISLYRLRPEFYGEQPNRDLFTERAIKEAIHEIGHTLGLRHCPNPTCVMHFSLHIGMTDRKRREFCNGCRRKIERYLNPFRAPDFL